MTEFFMRMKYSRLHSLPCTVKTLQSHGVLTRIFLREMTGLSLTSAEAFLTIIPRKTNGTTAFIRIQKYHMRPAVLYGAAITDRY